MFQDVYDWAGVPRTCDLRKAIYVDSKETPREFTPASDIATEAMTARSIVGDGSTARRRSTSVRSSFRKAIGRPASAWSLPSRISTACAARILVIARALPSSLSRALRSPPERGVGWCFPAEIRQYIGTICKGPSAAQHDFATYPLKAGDGVLISNICAAMD